MSSPLPLVSSQLPVVSSPLSALSSPLSFMSSPLIVVSSPLPVMSSPLSVVSSLSSCLEALVELFFFFLSSCSLSGVLRTAVAAATLKEWRLKTRRMVPALSTGGGGGARSAVFRCWEGALAQWLKREFHEIIDFLYFLHRILLSH